jgi:hypothetical protein
MVLLLGGREIDIKNSVEAQILVGPLVTLAEQTALTQQLILMH